ncbi:hypothetical protein [Agathobaculum sp. Marseille-P7918]|uniref:hypothetical protein n=1 Tax=Agathobaculum sp. Marseille-P7918 TaxID=2479843 RepID=UPI0035618CE2
MMNIEGMQPLSLEQAQGMDGQPVWYKQMKQWFIVSINHKNWGDCIVGANSYASLENAVERGLYAYPPVTIDRETLNCAGCDYLDRECVPCAHCIRAAGYADYYKPQEESE